MKKEIKKNYYKRLCKPLLSIFSIIIVCIILVCILSIVAHMLPLDNSSMLVYFLLFASQFLIHLSFKADINPPLRHLFLCYTSTVSFPMVIFLCIRCTPLFDKHLLSPVIHTSIPPNLLHSV